MSKLIQSTLPAKSNKIFNGINSDPKKISSDFGTDLIPELTKDKNKYPTKSLKQLNGKKYPSKAHYIIFLLIIFISVFSPIYTSEKAKIRKSVPNNYITITIEASGSHKIIDPIYLSFSKNIIINGKGSINSDVQDLESNSNKIILQFDSQLTWGTNMFAGSENISTIDVTHLDFTKIEYLISFFEGCTSLKSVDLSGIDASEVLKMDNMFKGCTSLESVNFNNFKTNKIIIIKYVL